MPTSDEIKLSVKEADAARTAKRSDVCTRVAELAELRAARAEQLAETERELGEVLADGGEVITIDEVAQFTGVSASELDQLLAGRKTVRGKRKRSTGTGRGRKPDQDHDTSTVTVPADVETPTPREPAASPEGVRGLPRVSHEDTSLTQLAEVVARRRTRPSMRRPQDR